MTYKGRTIRITSDFSPETMEARRAWTDVIQTLREHKCQPRLLLLYLAKLSNTIDGETKVFHDKNKFTHYLSMNPALQRIIAGNKTIQGQKPRPRKSKNVIPQQTKKYSHKNRILTLKTKNAQSKERILKAAREPQEHNANFNNKINRKQQLLFLNISEYQWTQLPNKKI